MYKLQETVQRFVRNGYFFARRNRSYLDISRIDDINEGNYDLVAVGRALLADHEWALKMEEGRLDDIKPYKEDTLKTYF